MSNNPQFIYAWDGEGWVLAVYHPFFDVKQPPIGEAKGMLIPMPKNVLSRFTEEK